MAPVIVLSLLALLILAIIYYKRPARKITLPPDYKQLLSQHVRYYGRLSPENKARFENRISAFLGLVRIDGVDTPVEDIDKLLVASSAVIPVFGFEKWTYFNLKNVLLYPAAFNREEFLVSGYEKNTLGMVGNGPMQRVMILSKPALRFGFQPWPGRENTGIHEFVHLLDKEDGDVDGLPEALMKKELRSRWLQLAESGIESIAGGRSDISYYGASSKAEFLAVAAEYFFNCPEEFKENHPALFDGMCGIFHQDPSRPNERING
jgi:Mlc titration factor MtfA (ptsG expression regulator)